MNERDFVTIQVLLIITAAFVIFWVGFTLGCFRTATEFYKEQERQQRIEHLYQGVHIA